MQLFCEKYHLNGVFTVYHNFFFFCHHSIIFFQWGWCLGTISLWSKSLPKNESLPERLTWDITSVFPRGGCLHLSISCPVQNPFLFQLLSSNQPLMLCSGYHWWFCSCLVASFSLHKCCYYADLVVFCSTLFVFWGSWKYFGIWFYCKMLFHGFLVFLNSLFLYGVSEKLVCWPLSSFFSLC